MTGEAAWPRAGRGGRGGGEAAGLSFGLQGRSSGRLQSSSLGDGGGTDAAGGLEHPSEHRDFPLLFLESSLVCEQPGAGWWVGLSRTFLQGHP